MSLSALLTSGSSIVNGEQISFTLGGIPVGNATTDGSGNATLNGVSLSDISAGTHTGYIGASFAGDTNYAASSGTGNLTVSQASTTTTVSSSINPSVFGRSVTLSATVSVVSPGSGIPTGNVTFFDGVTPLGNSTLESSGNATFSTSALSVGNHSISARYSGDANFTASTGTLAGGLTVNQASTTITVASASGIYGGIVDLSATLTSGGIGLSGEEISFTLGGSPVGNATTDSSGNATLTGVSLSGISAGTYTGYIGASFAGDTNYSTSSGSGNLTVGSSMDISLKAGWNMVSVPLTLGNSSVGAVFPGAAVVYTWDPVGKTYIMPTTIEANRGYWVAVVGNMTIPVTGIPVSTWTSALKAGWNMTGDVINNASIANPNDSPDSSVLPFAYWWDPVSRGYIYTTDMEPSKGYWVASVQDCTLTVP